MEKPIIDARQAIQDIRAGMDDAALMRKYRLSARGLQSLYTKLLESGFLNPREIEDRLENPEGSVIIEYSGFPSPQQKDLPKRSSPEKTGNALVASEDSGFLSLVKGIVESFGLCAVMCENVLPDEELMRQVTPRIILVDIGERNKPYFEMVRVAQRMDRTIPVIAVVPRTDPAVGTRALEEGAFWVVESPSDPVVLTTAIRHSLEHEELRRFKASHDHITEEKVLEETLELSRSTHFLKGILDSSSLVSIIVTDTEQTIRFWNKGAENIFGYTAEEMVGQRISRLYPPDALTKDAVSHLREVLSGEDAPRHGKLKQITKDGRILTISLAVSPLINTRGEVEGIVGIGLDVTEEVRQTKEIMKLLHQVRQTQDVSIFTLARLTEVREGGVESHLSRMQDYCRTLCARLGAKGRYRETVIPKYLDDIVRSSVLHDIGKVALPDSVVLCTEEYTSTQRELMKQHTLIGGKALQDAVKKIGMESFLTLGMEIAYYHHERWDGSGYPFGLQGDEIPLSARIVAVADVYDGITSPRPYRKAMAHDDACAFILEEAGHLFDPELIVAFEHVSDDFGRIRTKYP